MKQTLGNVPRGRAEKEGMDGGPLCFLRSQIHKKKVYKYTKTTHGSAHAYTRIVHVHAIIICP